MDDLKKKSVKKKDIYCGNCGKFGHTYKKCTAPTTSLGIILYKIDAKNKLNFLLIQRKDSIGFVEFLRGRYKLTDPEYIIEIFSKMTRDEVDRIKINTFNKLWEDLWMSHNYKQYKSEYENSKSKFSELKKGFFLDKKKIDIDFIINEVKNNGNGFWNETEWGFPKGRRNLKESDINCASREFQEETGYIEGEYVILKNIEPVEELYTGTNNIIYKHIYYIGKCISDKDICVKEDNKIQIAEVKNVAWFNKEDALKKLRPCHIKKKEVLEYVYQIINNNNLDKNSLFLYKSPILKEIIGNNDIDEDIVVI